MSIMHRTLIAVLLLASSVAQAQTISYFRIAGTAASIAAGPDGNLWFTSYEAIGRITPRGEVTTFSVYSGMSTPGDIAAGSNLMWFVRTGGLGSIDMNGTVTTYDIPSMQPLSVAAGSGQVFFGYYSGIGRLNTATGAVTLTPLAKPIQVLSMAAGADGNVWFVEYPLSQVGVVSPGGQISEFALGVCCSPIRITKGPDTNFWLAFNQGDHMASMSAASVTGLYEAPRVNGGRYADISSITYGPDGQVWFGTYDHMIGSVSSTGTMRTLAVSTDVAGINNLTAGPDGNIWATLERNPNICFDVCGPAEPRLPLAIARVNLINPAPVITAMPKVSDPATKTPTLSVQGVGFVPNTVIRWDGIDLSTVYVSPFEVQLAPAQATLAVAYGGTFLAHNPTPGGGDSPAFTLAPAPSPPAPLRRRAVH